MTEAGPARRASRRPVASEAFPDVLELDRMKLPLVYHFEPGAEQDGVTVTVPREGLAQLSEERLGWLVPGLVADKVEALIRSLPKAVRRNFGPAPDVARKIAGKLTFASGPLPADGRRRAEPRRGRADHARNVRPRAAAAAPADEGPRRR